MKVRIKGNLNLKVQIMEDINRQSEDDIKSILMKIAQSIIDLSPLGPLADAPNGRYATGAYMASHSVSLKGAKDIGAALSSRNRENRSVPNDGGSGIKMKIRNATLNQLKRVTFSNASPHAEQVEYGGPNWRRRKGYRPYGRTAEKFGGG